MARYVDGFVVPVPKKKLAAYRRMAQTAGRVWRDHGALEYIESVADDVKRGKWTSFPRSVKLKSNETVVFSYIVYKSKAQRDRINAKVMKDPRFVKMENPKAMPYDGKDPMLFAAHAINALQTIVSRNLHPQDAAVVSITQVHAGDT